MKQLLIAVIGSSTLLLNAIPALAEDPANEVHLISIYQGFEQTDNKIHGPKAMVKVDRPGKQVTLVLTSYSGATWHVSATKDTRIKRVVLGGYEQQAIQGVPETTEITKAWRGQTPTPLYYSYKPEGPAFRKLVKQTYVFTKTEISSFHGVSQARPDMPFVIDKAQNDPRLTVSFPQPTSLEELPMDLRDIKFAAHHYVSGPQRHELSVSFGQHTPFGPMEKELKPLPARVTRVVHDHENKTTYGISDHGVVQIDGDTNSVVPLELGLDVPRLSWPCEITYDTKRKRVIVGSSGGGGFLYAFSTESRQWSVISKRPGSLDAFTYSPSDDSIYGVLFDRGDDESRASLAKVNAEGVIVSRIPLGSPIEPGSLTNGPGVCTTQVAIAGKHIAILASPGGIGDREHLDTASIYLVDYETKKVWLTFKKTVEISAK